MYGSKDWNTTETLGISEENNLNSLHRKLLRAHYNKPIGTTFY